MSSKKKYYMTLDVIRIIACIAILLYHMNILRGGYLAVCTFFVLSGYLSVVSVFKKEKFSLGKYYLNRLTKLYIPLLLVVFLSISAVTLFKEINWLDLKPETTSVLLGYNNIWQLSENLDYFSLHVDSPFIHLWYIAILLQFDLVFPYIYSALRKIGDKVAKWLPCLFLAIISIAGAIFFCENSVSGELMVTYYSTATRVFSLFFGMTIGFIHSYYGPLVIKAFKKKFIRRAITLLYLLVLLASFFYIDAQSKFLAWGIIGASIISCRLIDYSVLSKREIATKRDRLVRFLANSSYEIYLVQYPVIFLMQYVDLSYSMKLGLSIAVILFIAFILHYCLNARNKNKIIRILKYAIIVIIVRVSIIGVHQYIIAEDHTSEMRELEEQLAQNEIMAEEKQEEYAARLKQEEEDWFKKLSEFEDIENRVKELVAELSVVGVGDSVMLGAVDNLYKQFPNGYFDAKVSRSIWVATEVLAELEDNGLLGEPVILNLGANGDCTDSCRRKIVEAVGERELFWVNVTNDDKVHVNDKLTALDEEYENVHVIDWNSISNGHKEYFYADGIHLTNSGMKAYTEAIYEKIVEVYLDKYNGNVKNEIEEHEQKLKSRLTFYGNDVLLNALDELHEKYDDALFITSKNITYASVKKGIKETIADGTITNRLVFAFDESTNIGEGEYEELIELADGRELYFVAMNEDSWEVLKDVDYENVTIVNFYQEIVNHKEYLMADKVHLTKEGNAALLDVLTEVLK